MNAIQDTYFHTVPEDISKRLNLKLRIDNGQRIYAISMLALFFFCLFMGLDYIRYTEDKLVSGTIYFYLFLNHLAFLLFIIPVLVIRFNREGFASGQYRYVSLFMYTWTILLGIMLLSMAILSLIDRDSMAMYSVYIIIANFGLILIHSDRLLLNSISFLIIVVAVFLIFNGNLELLVINLMEATGITLVSFVVSTQIFNAYVVEIYSDQLLEEKSAQIEKEKKRGDTLLGNILPKDVARELMASGSVEPRQYKSATVMFIDFKDFVSISQSLTTNELIVKLDYCFKNFDRIAARHRLEKIKTIGDAYFCAGGIPEINDTHATDCVEAALEIMRFLRQWKTEQIAADRPYFEARIGIHTGPVITGVVGETKFAYDVWGDTVNIAARIEAISEPGKINISKTTYDLVKDSYQCEQRETIALKSMGPLEMYYVIASIS